MIAAQQHNLLDSDDVDDEDESISEDQFAGNNSSSLKESKNVFNPPSDIEAEEEYLESGGFEDY
jgi:hypothetical protein